LGTELEIKMKWEKTETIEFNLDELPDSVYEVLVPHVCKGIEIRMTEGQISIYHEWDSDEQFRRGENISSLAQGAADRCHGHQGAENEYLQNILDELLKAAEIVRGAMVPNK